jgi:hypothetical protein
MNASVSSGEEGARGAEDDTAEAFLASRRNNCTTIAPCAPPSNRMAYCIVSCIPSILRRKVPIEGRRDARRGGHAEQNRTGSRTEEERTRTQGHTKEKEKHSKQHTKAER